MDGNILNVTDRAFADNAIANAEIHAHTPYTSPSYNNNDEIRIKIQNEDSYTLPCKSFIHIEGRVTLPGGVASDKVKFVNNGLAFLFQKIRYELNGITVDCIRNPGVASTMKSYVSYNANQSKALENAGWYGCSETATNLIDSAGYFNACIPLSMLLGFAEDFQKIIMNLKQELIIVRSNTDLNALVSTDSKLNPNLKINKISWNVPHISAGEAERLMLLNLLNVDAELEIAFRSWDLQELPLLQETRDHKWVVSTTSQLEKPRFIIFGFQTAAKNSITENMSIFKNCHLSNIQLTMNSQRYPYDNLNLDFDKNYFARLYVMYAQFQSAYYGRLNEPIMSPIDFKKFAPLVIIDCQHQNEILKTGSVDITLSYNTSQNMPPDTAAYCLILHDKIVKYYPSYNKVRPM